MSQFISVSQFKFSVSFRYPYPSPSLNGQRRGLSTKTERERRDVAEEIKYLGIIHTIIKQPREDKKTRGTEKSTLLVQIHMKP
jgi:hypothetical protein